MTNWNMTFWKSKYFWWAVAAVLVWVCVSDYFIHQKILADNYAQSSGLWRTGEDMQQHFWWMFFGQFMISFWMCWIFPHGYRKQGQWEGMRFGLWIGFFSCAHYFMQYAVSPMPVNLLWAWCLLTLAQCMAAGWIVGRIWEMNPAALKISKTA